MVLYEAVCFSPHSVVEHRETTRTTHRHSKCMVNSACAMKILRDNVNFNTGLGIQQGLMYIYLSLVQDHLVCQSVTVG